MRIRKKENRISFIFVMKIIKDFMKYYVNCNII